MSDRYPTLQNTNFPNAIDNFDRFEDPDSTEALNLINAYYNYLNTSNLNAAQALLRENAQLRPMIVNAENLNNLRDGLIAVEQFFRDDIQGYMSNIIQYKGVWSSTTTYQLYDVVSYTANDTTSAYMCLGNGTTGVTGVVPTNSQYWTPLSWDEIFVATYNSTSYEDVNKALNDGKVVLVRYSENFNSITCLFANYLNQGGVRIGMHFAGAGVHREANVDSYPVIVDVNLYSDSRGWSANVYDLSTDASDVFVATYNPNGTSTTYDEITTALSNGKTIILQYIAPDTGVVLDLFYRTKSTNTDNYYFAGFTYVNNSSYAVQITLSPNNIWTHTYKLLIPDQSGNQGKFLKTDGSNVSWADASDELQTKINTSGILKGNGNGNVGAAVAGIDYQAPLPSQTGNSGKSLTTNGTNIFWGDVDAFVSIPYNQGGIGNTVINNFWSQHKVILCYFDPPIIDYTGFRGYLQLIYHSDTKSVFSVATTDSSPEIITATCENDVWSYQIYNLATSDYVGNRVFIARYNPSYPDDNTTFAELNNAYQENKLIVCKYGATTLHYAMLCDKIDFTRVDETTGDTVIAETRYIFSNCSNNTDGAYFTTFRCTWNYRDATTDGTWSQFNEFSVELEPAGSPQANSDFFLTSGMVYTALADKQPKTYIADYGTSGTNFENAYNQDKTLYVKLTSSTGISGLNGYILPMIKRDGVNDFLFAGTDGEKNLIYVRVNNSTWTISLATVAKTNSPAFSGTPTAPTPDAQSNNNQIATKGYVNTAISSVSHDQIILDSSTPNSSKQFRITVDDSGTITATEIV